MFILDSHSVGMNIFSVSLGLLRYQSSEYVQFMVAFAADLSVHGDCCVTSMYQCPSWGQWKHCATLVFCWAMEAQCLLCAVLRCVRSEHCESFLGSSVSAHDSATTILGQGTDLCFIDSPTLTGMCGTSLSSCSTLLSNN